MQYWLTLLINPISWKPGPISWERRNEKIVGFPELRNGKSREWNTSRYQKVNIHSYVWLAEQKAITHIPRNQYTTVNEKKSLSRVTKQCSNKRANMQGGGEGGSRKQKFSPKTSSVWLFVVQFLSVRIHSFYFFLEMHHPVLAPMEAAAWAQNFRRKNLGWFWVDSKLSWL
jgi:hypothetical protein